MSNSTHSIGELLSDWMSFLIWAVTVGMAWVLGNARKTWTIEQNQKAILQLDARLTLLERAIQDDSVDVAVLKNEVQHIRKAVDEMRGMMAVIKLPAP